MIAKLLLFCSVMAKDVLIHEVDTILKNMGKAYVDSLIKEYPSNGLQEHILHIKICEVQDSTDLKVRYLIVLCFFMIYCTQISCTQCSCSAASTSINFHHTKHQ